jgi:hypothetical protein
VACWKKAFPKPASSSSRSSGTGQRMERSACTVLTLSASASACIVCSAAAASSAEQTPRSTRAASPTRPRDTSQRGDSGMQSRHSRISAGGPAPTPIIQRHAASSGRKLKAQPATNPNRMPTLIATSKKETNIPLIHCGESSLMYSGAIMIPAPTASPHSVRPAISTAKPYSPAGAAAMTTEPNTDTAHVTPTVPRRPSRESASQPEPKPPAADTRLREPTSASVCGSVSSRSRWMTRLAPLITPMS